MSFTMFSAALLLAVGAVVFAEALRGVKRGLFKTLIELAITLLGALCASQLALWLSDYPADKLREIVMLYLPVLETAATLFPSLPLVVTAAADALLSALMFLLFFLLLRGILRLIVALLLRTCLRSLPDDGGYDGEHAPWYVKHTHALGGVAGGLCGFLVSLLLLSPVLGVMTCADQAMDAMESSKMKWSTLGLTDDMAAELRSYTHDPAVRVLYAAGGEVVFRATAATELGGEHISLASETEACCGMIADITSVFQCLSDPSKADELQRKTLEGMEDRINSARITRMLAADFLNRAAESWLSGEQFLKISRPACGELIDPLMEDMLQVCAESDADCVGRDVGTVLRIYLIAVDNDLLTSLDYSALAKDLEGGGVLDLIYAELRRNPCMTHLSDELTYIALRIMASAIEWHGFSDATYRDFMSDLADAMNQVNELDTGFEQQVQSMTEYTLHYAGEYGLEIPESLAEMAATAMVQQMGGMTDLTHDDFQAFLDYYLNGS